MHSLGVVGCPASQWFNQDICNAATHPTCYSVQVVNLALGMLLCLSIFGMQWMLVYSARVLQAPVLRYFP